MAEKLSQMREQIYADPRPKEYFDRYHERARTRDPNWVYELVRFVTSLYSYTALRARAISAEKVPATGPVILAPNHFSFMDHFLLGAYIRRKIRFMGKSQLFKPPAVWIYSPGGVFPVRRGAADEETFITAETILARGGLVAMYCEGGRSRSDRLQPKAKRGIGRLALESGAPVVPVAIYGSAKIRNWKRLRFPRVSLLYGDPISFPREPSPSPERQQQVADEIFAEIRLLYARLEERGHQAEARDARLARRQSVVAHS